MILRCRIIGQTLEHPGQTSAFFSRRHQRRVQTGEIPGELSQRLRQRAPRHHFSANFQEPVAHPFPVGLGSHPGQRLVQRYSSTQQYRQLAQDQYTLSSRKTALCPVSQSCSCHHRFHTHTDRAQPATAQHRPGLAGRIGLEGTLLLLPRIIQGFKPVVGHESPVPVTRHNSSAVVCPPSTQRCPSICNVRMPEARAWRRISDSGHC